MDSGNVNIYDMDIEKSDKARDKEGTEEAEEETSFTLKSFRKSCFFIFIKVVNEQAAK
jgi:hypothetical protein